MRCSNCARTINPETAWSDHHGRKFGPICATRQIEHQFTYATSLRTPLKGSCIAVRASKAVRQNDNQLDIFGVTA